MKAAPRALPRVRTRIIRTLGVPALFAVGMSSVGASVYFALGVVARDALGLTPVAFLVAAAFLGITMMTYLEAASLHPERGGASTFARYAFDELWSFVAGWAILLDYLIVMALAATAVPHYLAAFWGGTGRGAVEEIVAIAVIGWVAWVNVRGLHANRLGLVLRLVLVNLAVLAAVVAAGLLIGIDPRAGFDTVELGSVPTWEGLIFATVIATVAMTGIEAASGLAGEVPLRGRELRRVVVSGSAAGLVLFVGISLMALAAVPVVGGTTELGGTYIGAPLLGVVSGYEPSWLMGGLGLIVGLVGALVLVQAVNTNMLGLSRLAYSLATNRQIPSAVGRLHRQRSTPYVAVGIASVAALGLVTFTDIEFLLGIFAFGALLTLTIAHVSVIVLRFREPESERAYRVPLSLAIGKGSVPLPALAGALASFGGWVSVVLLHEGARVAGIAWMAAGLALYVVYRLAEGHSLTRRFTVSADALRERPEAEYGSILVPIVGRPLDDDIVGTAGRLASEEVERGEGGPVIEALYVIQVPMSLPLDARVPDEQVAAARRALARAKEVGEEYEGVEVATAMVRGRTLGAEIVSEARRRGVEAIVLAAEEPTRMAGGGRFGGRGLPVDRSVGEMTKYVVEKAACRVVLTAPAAEEMPAVSRPDAAIE